jgi:lambda family phage tail tape measure protein
MANMLGRLGVVLGLDSAEFVSGITKAEKSLTKFANDAVQIGKVAATALAAMSVAAIKFADDIQDVAQANDVAIDTVIKLRSALDASGGSADKAGVMLSAFTKFIDTAASGSFEAQKAFKAVGISFKDLGRLSQEELLGKALKGLESIDDQVTRGARGMDLFSKAAKGVALDQFAQEMQKTSNTTKEQVEAVKEGAKTWDNFERIVRKLQLAFVEALGPSLRAINNQMSAEAFPKLTMLNKLFNSIASNAFSAGQAIDALGKGFQNIAGQSLILQTHGETDLAIKEIKKLNEEYVRFLENQRKAQTNFDLDLEGRRGIRTDVYPKGGRPKISGDSSIVRQTVLGVDSKAEALRAKAEAERKKQEEAEAKAIKINNEALLESRLNVMDLMKGYEQLTKQNYEAGMRQLDLKIKELKAEEDIKFAKDQAFQDSLQSNRLEERQLDFDRANLLLLTQFRNFRKEEVNYAQDVMSIRAKYAEQEYQIATFSIMEEDKKKEAIENNNKLRDRAIEQAKEVLEITRQETEGSQQKGFYKGFDEFVRNMPNQLEIGKQSFNALVGSMDDALSNFVRNGKWYFKDFARSLIQDMIMIQARAAMMGMMKDLHGAFFRGGLPSVSLSTPVGMGTGGGYADGGDPPVGRVSLVGERGPELFVPRTAGTIIPNNQLANAMGGGQTINYNGPYIASMNAIDTQSGTQFLARNKQAVWGAYQSANRSVPVTR